MLNQPLYLPEGLARDEQIDAEPFCRGIYRRSGLELSHCDEEDAITFLIETCWELSLDYERGRIRKGFGAYATIALKRRLVDWQRQRFGRTTWQFADRTYERALPSFVSLEHQPDDAECASTMDAGRDSGSPLAWVLGARDSERARSEHALGEAEARRAA